MSENINLEEIMHMFFELYDKANTDVGLDYNDIDIIKKTEDGFYYNYKEKNFVSIKFVDDKRNTNEKFFLIYNFNEVELINFEK